MCTHNTACEGHHHHEQHTHKHHTQEEEERESETQSNDSFDEELLKPLIHMETDDFTPKFKKILDEIFERYDEDKDGHLNHQELQTFAKTSNEGETVKQRKMHSTYNRKTKQRELKTRKECTALTSCRQA